MCILLYKERIVKLLSNLGRDSAAALLIGTVHDTLVPLPPIKNVLSRVPLLPVESLCFFHKQFSQETPLFLIYAFVSLSVRCYKCSDETDEQACNSQELVSCGPKQACFAKARCDRSGLQNTYVSNSVIIFIM